ncbi:hypothetical protein GCM10010245_66440 [Streptomyces spectabilis]|uniref:Uncharacterized protein n=1 Tax=Streptomyces spectabilis TaxID=68270 RepID=A0A7W8B204_STRST|nr:hypothetical protein [Streptomyces spectabilis]GGV42357.1 hypothetical protein GCM10010245_66440 [Streptomyces spectabilis]
MSLYDEDFPDADDHLGSNTVGGSKVTLTFNLDDALRTLATTPPRRPRPKALTS